MVVPPDDGVLGVDDGVDGAGVVVFGAFAFLLGFGVAAGVEELDDGGGLGVACGTVSGEPVVLAGGGVGVA